MMAPGWAEKIFWKIGIAPDASLQMRPAWALWCPNSWRPSDLGTMIRSRSCNQRIIWNRQLRCAAYAICAYRNFGTPQLWLCFLNPAKTISRQTARSSTTSVRLCFPMGEIDFGRVKYRLPPIAAPTAQSDLRPSIANWSRGRCRFDQPAYLAWLLLSGTSLGGGGLLFYLWKIIITYYCFSFIKSLIKKMYNFNLLCSIKSFYFFFFTFWK